ncbi:hypothetical protein V9T40_009660 [Parthenolecanium corni]|uniref:non-specific serine/threonine protein kinase n=1 Tax=Parthenolecanium corni TaxID=536013 RepID=A0AAN9TZP2_9HEMI
MLHKVERTLLKCVIVHISVKKKRGKFAAVRKCTHKITGIEYAAKFIRKRRRSMDQRNDILHEIAVLRLAQNCSHIVNIHEVYETPTEMALVLELVAGGELQRVIDIHDGLEEVQAIHVLQQILTGLSFLHKYKIAHLDLKPQNLLITSSFPHCDIKLCDFGISRVIENGIELREILGTPDYVAPEVLNYEPISLATDIWSVGVLAYVLLSGYSPFAGDTKQETFCNIAQCTLSFPQELFSNVSECAKDFIMATLVPDGSQRLTVDECLHHPWLSNFPLKSCIDVILPSAKEELYSNSLEMCSKNETTKYINCAENICNDSEYCGRDENEHNKDISITSVDVIVDRGIPC